MSDTNNTLDLSVYDDTLIPSVLLTKEYYIDQLTLLLKNSFGVPEQTTFFTDILNVFHSKELDFFNLLGIYNNDTKRWHINIEKINEICEKEYGKGNHSHSDLLDKIAEIVGCSRYYSFLGNSFLNNDELYILINFRILQNNYQGTYAELEDIYSRVFTGEYEDFKITYYTSTSENSTCTLELDKSKIVDENGEILDKYKNLYQLFIHDLLEIKSLGIKYNKVLIEDGKFGFFDRVPISINEDTGEITYDESSDFCKFGTAYFC